MSSADQIKPNGGSPALLCFDLNVNHIFKSTFIATLRLLFDPQTGSYSLCKINTKINHAEKYRQLKNWLSNTKWASLKTYIQVILYRLSILYLYILQYMHINKIHKFIRDKGRVYGKIREKKGEGEIM